MTTSPLSSLQGTLHECEAECSAAVGGHELSFMQERLASATPSKWRDAVVVSASTAGWVEIALIADGSSAVLWNHFDLTGVIAAGDPVAVHSVYGVFAAGGSKYNVLQGSSI